MSFLRGPILEFSWIRLIGHLQSCRSELNWSCWVAFWEEGAAWPSIPQCRGDRIWALSSNSKIRSVRLDAWVVVCVVKYLPCRKWRLSPWHTRQCYSWRSYAPEYSICQVSRAIGTIYTRKKQAKLGNAFQGASGELDDLLWWTVSLDRNLLDLLDQMLDLIRRQEIVHLHLYYLG